MRPAAGGVALGLALILVAGLFAAAALYVTGAALVLLGAGAAGWIWLGARGASIKRSIDQRTVIERQPVAIRVRASAGKVPLPPGIIDDPLLAQPVRIAACRREVRIDSELTFNRRGRRVFAPPAMIFRDPLGLAEKVCEGERAHELLVLPEVFEVRALPSSSDGVASHARAALLAANETEVDGLREHDEGAPASRIHWPTVARGGGMMERRLISKTDTKPLVLLDPRSSASADALDAAVRAAASLTVHFARRGGCSILLPGQRRATLVEPDLQAWTALHVRLALVGSDVGPTSTAAQNRHGLIVYVCARVIDRPPRDLGRTPGGGLLVVPGELSGRTAVVEVAGCKGYAIGRGDGARALANLS